MDLNLLYQKYGKEIVDRAVRELSYKEVSTMPKVLDSKEGVIYLFRHGQSEDNEKMIFSGWRDVSLTEKGRAQALILSDKLKDKKIDILISSTQKRAIETLELAISKNLKARDIEIITDARLRERSYGDLEGTSKLELYITDKDKCQEYRRGYYTKAKNGESLEDVVKRVEEFILELIPVIRERKINVAISCHGNSIRGFRKFFEKLTPSGVSKIETPLGEDYLSYQVL